MPKLTKKLIDSLEPKSKEYYVWDSELKGLGIRVYPSGRKVFVIQYRMHGRTCKMTLGAYPLFRPDQARKRAMHILAQVADGNDPKVQKKQRDITVRELCDWYLEEGVSTKADSTLTVDRGRIRRHIKPLLGDRLIGSLTQADMEKFQADNVSIQPKDTFDILCQAKGNQEPLKPLL